MQPNQKQIAVGGAGCVVVIALLWFWLGWGARPGSEKCLLLDNDLAAARIVTPAEEPGLLQDAAPESSRTALNRDVEDALRNRFINPSSRSKYMTWSAADLMAAYEASNDNPKERLKILWALCFLDDPSVVDFLTDIERNENENEYLRASILEGLAIANKAWGHDLVLESLRSESEVIARGAVRALGHYGSNDAVDTLSRLAFDFERDPTISLAAASALGEIGSPKAAKVLMDLFENGVLNGKNDALEFALSGLGKIDSQEVGSYLKEIYDLATDPEIRALIFDGLEGSEGDISQIVRAGLADKNADVRAAAASALAYDDADYPLADLMGCMEKETDAEVRRNLYLALDNQESLDVARLMAMVQRESSASTQLAGYQLLCRQLMNVSGEAYAALSNDVRAGLMSLKETNEISPQEMGVIDRMIDRIDRTPSH